MGFLAQAKKGKLKRPNRVVVYGVGGLGKTTFGAEAPDAIIVGPEAGSDEIDNVTRVPGIVAFKDVMDTLKELLNDPHDYKTVVIDSADWIEPLIYAAVVKAKGGETIETTAGGFGKGYGFALIKFTELLNALDALRDKRSMGIVVVAHEKQTQVTDPKTFETYQRHDLKLHQKMSDLLKEWADAVFFASPDTEVSSKDGKVKAFKASDENIIHTKASPGWYAKNRYGLPPILKLRYSAFEEALAVARNDDFTAVKGEVDALLAQVEDGEVRRQAEDAIKDAGENVRILKAYLERLKELTIKDV